MSIPSSPGAMLPFLCAVGYITFGFLVSSSTCEFNASSASSASEQTRGNGSSSGGGMPIIASTAPILVSVVARRSGQQQHHQRGGHHHAHAHHTHHTHRSAQQTEMIFRQSLGSDPWSAVLGNPCAARPTPRAFAHENVLDVDGREHEVRTVAAMAAMHAAHLKANLRHSDCADQQLDTLSSLPSEFLMSEEATTGSGLLTPAFLRQAYMLLYETAAHAHFVAADWHEGRSCSIVPIVTAQTAERLSSSLVHMMCSLMIASDPHPFSAPYPSDELLSLHQSALRSDLLHYHDCSARSVRDCVVADRALLLATALRNRAQASSAASLVG